MRSAPKMKQLRVDGRTLEPRVGGKYIAGFLSTFMNYAQAEATKTMVDLAEEIKRRVVFVLNNQTYAWKPLTEAYLEWKFKNKLDLRTLIATGYYRDHIEWWIDSHNFVHVGVRPNAIHKPSGLRLVTLARIHEFGTRHVPARPLWRPTISAVIRESARFRRAYYKNVVDNMRSGQG